MNQQPIAPTGGPSTMKWLLIILAIVIVLGGGYWVYTKYIKGGPSTTASPSPAASVQAPSSSAAVSPSSSSVVPADWKTYSNTQYGFSLKYPSAWQQTAGSGSMVVNLSLRGADNGPLDPQLVIFAYSQSLTDLKASQDPSNNLDFKSMTVDGHDAFITTKKNGYEKEIIVESGTGSLLITDKGSPVNEWDTIISNFQFTQ